MFLTSLPVCNRFVLAQSGFPPYHCSSPVVCTVLTPRRVPASFVRGDRGPGPGLAADPGSRCLLEDGHGGGRSLVETKQGLWLTEESVCWLPFRKDEVFDPCWQR